jgi:hypothetical protein
MKQKNWSVPRISGEGKMRAKRDKRKVSIDWLFSGSHGLHAEGAVVGRIDELPVAF